MKYGILKIHYTSSIGLNGYFLMDPDSQLSLRQQLVRSFLAKGKHENEKGVKWFSKYDKILIKKENEYVRIKGTGYIGLADNNRNPLMIWMNDKDLEKLHNLLKENKI